MRVLLDEQIPIDFAVELKGHVADTVAGRGWAGIKNGELLRLMLGQYDALITMDRSIEFQQRVSALPFGIIILRAASNRLEHLQPLVPNLLAAIASSTPGLVQHVHP